MQPPVCCIDSKDFDPDREGGLIEFKRTPEGEDFARQAAEEGGFTGHPPDCEWFCGKHEARARSLSHLTLVEAMAIMRREN